MVMPINCEALELDVSPPIASPAVRPINVLLLYHSHQTFTNTVFEHVNAFARFSAHRYFFCHHDGTGPLAVDLARFDAIVIHYCLRMPMDQVSDEAAQALADYRGAKVLFVQDEYEHTRRAWHWIRNLGIDLVFTVVPTAHVDKVYPPEQFPGTRFVSNLTGYVPESLSEVCKVLPPSARPTLVGYRGRHLPLVYGALGREKVGIGRMVRAYCERHGLSQDIAWTESARIYGAAWYPFVASCRAMLGSESGSNVFDWDGTLGARIKDYCQNHPQADEDELYRMVVEPREMAGVMNQVSPRIFEAIALKTALVLFEGNYSGVVEPWKHYIPLRKDGSNLDEVFARLQDGSFVDAMADRAWQDVIGSGRYSYAAFMSMVDREVELSVHAFGRDRAAGMRNYEGDADKPGVLTTLPVRWPPPTPSPLQAAAVLAEEADVLESGAASIDEPLSRGNRLRQAASLIWSCLPAGVRAILMPLVHGLLLPAVRALHGIHAANLQRKRAKSKK